MELRLEIDWSELPQIYRKSLDGIVKRWEKAAGVALDNAADEFLPLYKTRVEEIYKKSVEQFHASYTPHYYSRTNDLYNLLEVNISNRSFKITLHDERLEPSNSGIAASSLYEIVVEGGWHGGAPSGKNHPAPGTPYWRVPYPEYYTWGSPAEQSTPIFELFQSGYDSYLVEANELWQSLVQKHLDSIRL